MMNNDSIAFFVAANALLYLIIHLFLDLQLILNRGSGRNRQATEYPTWDENKPHIKYITLLTTLYFWVFFLFWPILHIYELDKVFFTFSVKIPVIRDLLQFVGVFLVSIATFVAINGRIARGQHAISWGVPQSLTTHGGFGLVRHPLYASYCYYFVGVIFLVQNILLVPLVLGVVGYYETAKYEEEILLAEFGKVYQKYQQRVGMLIPFIGKRKKSS